MKKILGGNVYLRFQPFIAEIVEFSYFCQQYLSGLSDDEFTRFKKYYVGTETISVVRNGSSVTVDASQQRKLVKTEMTFWDRFHKTLGKDVGATVWPRSASDAAFNKKYTPAPGPLEPWEYYAVTFEMPLNERPSETPPAGPSTWNTGKFSLGFYEPTVGSQNVIFAISPCPGDFRPRKSDGEHYEKGYCRSPFTGGVGLTVIKANTVLSASECYIPPNKKMYINMTLLDLYNQHLSSLEPTPPLGIPSEYYCGYFTKPEPGPDGDVCEHTPCRRAYCGVQLSISY